MAKKSKKKPRANRVAKSSKKTLRMFGMNSRVYVKLRDEVGTVVGRAEYVDSAPHYHVMTRGGVQWFPHLELAAV